MSHFTFYDDFCRFICYIRISQRVFEIFLRFQSKKFLLWLSLRLLTNPKKASSKFSLICIYCFVICIHILSLSWLIIINIEIHNNKKSASHCIRSNQRVMFRISKETNGLFGIQIESIEFQSSLIFFSIFTQILGRIKMLKAKIFCRSLYLVRENEWFQRFRKMIKHFSE